MAGVEGFEPPTASSKDLSSTAELHPYLKTFPKAESLVCSIPDWQVGIPQNLNRRAEVPPTAVMSFVLQAETLCYPFTVLNYQLAQAGFFHLPYLGDTLGLRA